MISASDFRNGMTIEIDGNVCQIIEFQHVKPGKGAAFVRTKLKNIISGGVVEKSFRPTEKFPQARIHRIGAKDTCHYIYLVARGTIDEKVMVALQGKVDLAKALVDDYRKGRNPFNI